MNDMKICYPFILNPTGGSFTSTKILIEKIDGEFDCQFVFTKEKSAAQYAREANIDTKILPLAEPLSEKISSETGILEEINIGVQLLPYIQKIRQYLKCESIDLVHTNDGLTATIWGIAAKTIGIPVIWHIRSERSSEWDAIRLKVCDHLIFVAESNKQRFSDSEISEIKKSTIHNGVDLTSFSANNSTYLHQELGINEDTQIVGFVGNLIHRKRPMLFVKSALNVLNEMRDVHFVLAGQDRDNYGVKIQNHSQEKGFSDKIHLLGYRDDVNKIMASLNLLVMTSTKHGEAFPRVPLEAMACGTPVITTDTAGVSESVIDGKTGFVMDTSPSAKDISNTILELLQNRGRLEKFSTNSASYAREKFSGQKYADEIKQVYIGLS